MRYPLHVRLEAVLALLRKLPGLEFHQFLTDWPEHLGDAPDAATIAGWDPRVPVGFREFAAALPAVRFEYEGPGLSGSMNLVVSATGLAVPDWIPAVPTASVRADAPAVHSIERKDPQVDLWVELDWPDGWNGSGANLALEAGGSSILYVFESTARYDDLEHYLTLGAKRGFLDYWPAAPESDSDVIVSQWQQQLEALRALSLDRSSAPATVVARLAAAGVEASLAEDIVAWLGQDATLYLPKEA